MIYGGYIIQPRCIQESDISVASPAVREIWAYLLREANSRDNKYNGHTIKRGQLFRSYEDIREGTKWFVGWRKMTYNENATKKAMKFLRETQRITTKKEPGGVMITICKYCYYQDPKNYERTTKDTNEGTNDEPMKNQCGTTYNKNNKNDKNNKNKESEEVTSFIPKPTVPVTEIKYDFIDLIIKEFAYAYEELFKNQYVIVTRGKERSAAIKLLKVYKDKYPDATTEQTLAGFQEYFNSAIRVNEPWFRDNMSLSLLVTKFNEINNILINGKTNSNIKKGGATDTDLAAIVSKHFAT